MLLILVGIILIISEFMIPLFGFFALVGLALIIAGTSLEFDPSLAEYGMAMIMAVSLSLSLIMGGGGIMAFKAHRRKTQTGKEGLIGDKAIILDWTGDQGRVSIDGEHWHAEAKKEYDFEKDDLVRVVEMRDLTLIVKPK